MNHLNSTNWPFYFDQIFLINLTHRKDRLATSLATLQQYQIPATIKNGLKLDDGHRGLFETMKLLFAECLANDFKRVLVLHDNFKLLDDINYYLPEMLIQLHEYDPDYLVLYLGADTNNQLQPVTPNVLHASGCTGSFAVCYTQAAMRQLMEHMRFYTYPFDQLVRKRLQEGQRQQCFITYPMLVGKTNGYSDIAEKEIDNTVLEKKFETNTSHLAKLQIEKKLI